MQLTPRYGADPLIVLDGPPAAVATPTIRQRRRLAAAVAAFDDQQWANPSRCAGWSSRDVISHLESTNSFWAFSIAAGLRGEPTQFLATFDPVATPAQLVAASAGTGTAELLDRFLASSEALCDLLASLDDDAWTALAEAPPGHLSVSALAHHALWDSWVHERDILLPLGIVPPEEPDEIAASLRYVVALAPAFAVNAGTAERGTIVVDVVDPDLALVVEVDQRVTVRSGDAPTADVRLAGDAVGLLEALSIRAPLDQAVPAGSAWLVNGLADVFDVTSR